MGTCAIEQPAKVRAPKQDVLIGWRLQVLEGEEADNRSEHARTRSRMLKEGLVVDVRRMQGPQGLGEYVVLQLDAGRLDERSETPPSDGLDYVKTDILMSQVRMFQRKHN